MCLRRELFLSFLVGHHFFSSILIFSYCFPLMPQEVEDRGIPSVWTGLILGVYGLPSILFSCWFNGLVHRFGRRKMYLTGFYFVMISAFLFGILGFIQNKTFFVVYGLIVRLVFGIGFFLTKGTIVSIASKRFPKNLDQINTLQNVSILVGFGVGPFVSSLIFDSTGNNIFWPSLVFGCILLCIYTPLAHYMLLATERERKILQAPSSTSSFPTNGSSSRLKHMSTTTQEKKFPVCLIFKSMRNISFLAVMFCHVFFQVFWSSSLQVELDQKYHKSVWFIGIAYSTRSLFALIFSFCTPCVIHRLGRPGTVLISLILHFIAFLLFGPSKVFQFPESQYFILAGLIVKGIADPFMYVPIFPDIIDQTHKHYKGKYSVGPIGDVVSAIANMMLDVGLALGQILGYYAFSKIGFRYSADLFNFLQIPMIALFVVFGGAFKEWRQICSKRALYERKESEPLETPRSADRLQSDQLSPKKQQTPE